MKFITEMELREMYRKEPFTTFVLPSDTRITPGARQFLVDRRVALSAAPSGNEAEAGQEEPGPGRREKKPGSQSLLRKMEKTESLFLFMAAELMHFGGTILSEEVLALGRYFRKVRQGEQEQRPPDSLQFWGWSAEEIRERSAGLTEQMDISAFGLDLEKSRDAVVLNYLRASLRELEPAISEVYRQEEESVCSRQDLLEAIAGLINILSLMIEKCGGGGKWQN